MVYYNINQLWFISLYKYYVIEKLRINNKVIEDALTERLQLVADILKVPLLNSIDHQNENVSDEPNALLYKTVSQG